MNGGTGISLRPSPINLLTYDAELERHIRDTRAQLVKAQRADIKHVLGVTLRELCAMRKGRAG